MHLHQSANKYCSKEGTTCISHKDFRWRPIENYEPKRHATNGQSDGCSKDKVEIEIIMHEANKPSNPSMKLQKLIIAVENTIINGRNMTW